MKVNFEWIHTPIVDLIDFTGTKSAIACQPRCRDKGPCVILCKGYCDIEMSAL